MGLINHPVFGYNIDIVVRLRGPEGIQPIIKDVDDRILYRGEHHLNHQDAYRAAIRAWELGETEEIRNRRITLGLPTPPIGEETQTWHCSRCDDDYPHTILHVDGDANNIKTRCTNCERETWR